MNWSSKEWQKRLEDLIEYCADKVFAELEEHAMGYDEQAQG